ncbi:GspH/FimT family pseudopilin [Chitinilyticum aquatile]|uniref:GspH/FimT family pseudopilin n=1 Tax=Chitinilyticum aquatile TaxID=362520 RepID=UPI0004205898|nr:GspH/FimT family pseudopilin [Chitinilyticum aquatile]
MRARHSGFTLIEMMITVGILGIVLAIAVPNLSAFVARTHLKGVADNLAQDLVFARSEAARQNKSVRLTLQGGTSSCYGLSIKATHCDCAVSDTGSSSYCELRRAGEFPAGITLAGVDNAFDQLIFDSARGLPVSSSHATLSSNQEVQINGRDNRQLIVKMSVLGSVCIYAPGKNTAGYPNAC